MHIWLAVRDSKHVPSCYVYATYSCLQCEEPDGPATQKPHEWLESMASSLPLETHGITAVKGVDLLPRVKAMAVHVSVD